MSKVNVRDFLKQNWEERRQYAFVEEDGNTALICFSKFNDEIFLPYHCQHSVKRKLENDADVNKLLENSRNKEYTQNMIVGKILYKINHQLCKSFSLEVDDIIPITERECLLYLLEIETVDSLRIKRDSKEKLQKCLVDSGNFDADTVKEIMHIFSDTAADYSFERK